ncbi:MAG: hypothetical protein F6K40_14480 [Okeania sp. SIO3I5]|uniref:hypothetical protein n=1 Tax=Okeania sp. SIO3I5 TaxID=2607805 RepID=UPI0013B98AD8|nr:hypothetical protein [Okeania sp. SIO3I5]NEQ37404.1 hypothetical protein [Okeania sp. SIO3I5]
MGGVGGVGSVGVVGSVGGVGSVGSVGSVGRNYKTYVSSPLLCRTTHLILNKTKPVTKSLISFNFHLKIPKKNISTIDIQGSKNPLKYKKY